MKIESTSLKPLSLTDVEFVYDLYNNPDIYETGVLTYKYQFSDLQVKNRLEKWLTTDNQKHFLINEDEVKAGLAQIYNIDFLNRKCNLGILINTEYFNKGIGSKALKLLINLCFNKLNLHKIEVSILNKNYKSIKMIENQGFIKEGNLKESVYKDGVYEDIYLYGLINSGEMKKL